MDTSLRKPNIIKLLKKRSLTGNKVKYDFFFDKNIHCLVCCEKLTSCFYMRAYGKFCKSCGYAAFNNSSENNYLSQQFFWHY